MTEDQGLDAVPLFDLDDAREDWSRLGELSGNVYLTWEWGSTWWRHFGSGELRLVGCRAADGELRAMLPLYKTSGRVRTLRLVGEGHAAELGPVCAPEDVPAATVALARFLRNGPRDWDVFLAHDVAPAWGWDAHFDGSVVTRTPSPLVELDGLSWDVYLAARTKSFRDDLRKNTRRLERSHRLTYRLVEDRSCLSGDLSTLFSLHRSLWGSEASAYFAGSEAFHRDFAALALERGWLRLTMLELDGEAVAANYGLRLGDVAWTYNSGRNSAIAGAGLLLTAKDIARSIEERATQYRLGRGATPFKDRFATACLEFETVGVPRGVLGRASLTARRYTRVLPHRARAWLERLAA